MITIYLSGLNDVIYISYNGEVLLHIMPLKQRWSENVNCMLIYSHVMSKALIYVVLQHNLYSIVLKVSFRRFNIKQQTLYVVAIVEQFNFMLYV